MVPVKRNRESLSNALRAELELTAVPELVNQRLRQVYAELPDGKTLRRRALPPWLRNTFAAASSLAAAFLVLLGVNTINPALAESLPLVGGIFQNINSLRIYGYYSSRNFNENQQRISQMAVPAGENQVEIPASGLFEKPAKASLGEVYYDGSFVFAGVDLEIDASEDRLTTLHRDGYDVLINGKPQVYQDEDGSARRHQYQDSGFVDMSGLWWERAENGHYVTQRAFRVPEQLQGAESLDISLCFSAIAGDKGNVNSTGFRLSFTAEKSPAALREIDCQGLEMGGVRLVRAYGTSAATYIEVEYPEELYQNPATAAAFEDGLRIGSYGYMGIGYGESPADGMAREALVLAGLREDEERKIVWGLFDKNGSSQWEAVFLLDFRNGTAELGSPEDVKPAPEYNYACGVEAVKALQPGEYAVEKLHVNQDKPMLYIMTGDSAERDLRVELYQEETLAIRTYSGQYVSDPWSPNAYYWEYGDNGVRDDAHTHAMYMLFLPDLYTQIDLTRPVTVKVFDKDSGELLCQQEITLTGSRPEAQPCSSPSPEESEGEAVESQAE